MPSQTAPNPNNLLLGKGQVLFDRYDVNGVSTGFRHLGNVERFEITTADDKVQKYSSMTASAPLYGESLRRRTATIGVTGDEFNADNVAIAQGGDVVTLVQTATAVVAEALAASTVPGSFVKLAKLGPYTGVAVKFGVTTGVLGVDYQFMNAKAGVIQILPGTALTGAVTADYTPTAYTSTAGPKVVRGASVGNIVGRLMFIGDPSSGPAQLVEVWRCTVSPDGALGYISDDYATMGMTFTILDDAANHPTNPLYQTTYLP
jgi:hypothetical protein